MPFLFTPNEYVDMLLIYGECRKNSRNAKALYQERFPERRTPSHMTFAMVEEKMRQGSFPNSKHSHHDKPIQSEQNMVNVLAYVAVNPHVSIRTIAEEIGVSSSSVHRILKTHNYHPFKLHLTHELRPTDPDRRLTFIAIMQVMMQDTPNLLSKILWSDEARFHNNGVVNRHNSHYWSVENPRWVRETRFQTRWGVNVWCGLFNGRLIGPYFFEGYLNGQRYLNILENELPALLDDIPLNERRDMIWQQDGAPPHNNGIVANYLNARFPNKWIGTHGPFRWPPRSPDMTPLDFFVWGYLKDLVYNEQPVDVNDLKIKIRRACNNLTQEMIHAACTRELLRRFDACVDADGGHFEHLL